MCPRVLGLLLNLLYAFLCYFFDRYFSNITQGNVFYAYGIRTVAQINFLDDTKRVNNFSNIDLKKKKKLLNGY